MIFKKTTFYTVSFNLKGKPKPLISMKDIKAT